MELKVDMGAGQGDLRVGDLALSRLEINIGAGQITADLTGDWKKNLEADIHGGVGHAIIRLPEDVGVRVHATGGIGSISAGGLKRDGDEYVNEIYGKSRVTLRLDVSGGVGNIELRPTPKAQ
jgi:predicted membrane protein